MKVYSERSQPKRGVSSERIILHDVRIIYICKMAFDKERSRTSGFAVFKFAMCQDSAIRHNTKRVLGRMLLPPDRNLPGY